MKLSVVIPAHNEEGSIAETVSAIDAVLVREGIEHEILVVNDHSTDSTGEVLRELTLRLPTMRHDDNPYPNGFGYAVRHGLEQFTGDAVAVMMGDLSDDPEDLVRFFRKMEEGYDCVFGTRFSKGGRTVDYPWPKLVLNRVANLVIRAMIGHGYNDTTNAFKLYRREAVEGLKPYLSAHFNLTIELPLKAAIRGYSFAIVPNSWTNRKHGESKLRIKEMGSRYFFILLYCLIEKTFSRGDYRRKQ